MDTSLVSMLNRCISGCLIFASGVMSPSVQAEVPDRMARALVAASRQSAAFPRITIGGALTRRRYRLPLRYSADSRSLLFLFLFVGLASIQWLGWFRHWALLMATCVLSFIACIIKHNHIHCRTFSRTGWNRTLDYMLGICTGQSTAVIIPVHNERHHGKSHTEQDCVRSTVVHFRRNWLNLLVFPFVVVRLVYQAKPSDLARWHEQKPSLYRRAQQERAVVVAFTTVLLVLDWQATLLCFAVPWLFGQWGIVTINLLQHQHCEHGSEYDHSRNVTGKFINWLFLNNGFHTAHHLRPALHWSQLPAFHRMHVEPRMRPDLNHRSLFLCIWKQFFSAEASREL